MFEIASEETTAIYRRLLSDIIIHEYREMVEIWDLQPESHWEVCKNYLGPPFREYLMLIEARKNLKKVFLEKIIKHGKKKKKTWDEDDEEDDE